MAYENPLGACLERLTPHVDGTRTAVTGSVAIGVHVKDTDWAGARLTATQDLDFVAQGIEAVRSSVTREFLVSHFHRPHAGYPKFMVQLVDPVSRVRVDFFPDTLGAVARASMANVAGVSVRLAEAPDILAHKLRLLAPALDGGLVEEKHYRDAVALGALCGRAVPTIPDSQLTRTGFSRDISVVCPRCQMSQDAAFPLGSKQVILDILGYV